MITHLRIQPESARHPLVHRKLAYQGTGSAGMPAAANSAEPLDHQARRHIARELEPLAVLLGALGVKVRLPAR